ncbi:MAG: helix-turn-helix transcriptional regulator [Eubacteriales bacterium]|nr:helix-turn-helix transcriptional regulator [Eubacteriales bacterium]
MSDFKKEVKIQLIHKGMTMTNLAEEMGISISYLSDLLNGKRTNQAQLDRIKTFLNLSDTEQYEAE